MRRIFQLFCRLFGSRTSASRNAVAEIQLPPVANEEPVESIDELLARHHSRKES